MLTGFPVIIIYRSVLAVGVSASTCHACANAEDIVHYIITAITARDDDLDADSPRLLFPCQLVA